MNNATTCIRFSLKFTSFSGFNSIISAKYAGTLFLRKDQIEQRAKRILRNKHLLVVSF